jgi:hypothetical protein
LKAKITFFIGLFVLVISSVQLGLSHSLFRLTGVAVGLFFMVWGWKIGWTTHKRLTALIGHLAIVVGCVTIAYGLYQIPFMQKQPNLIQIVDLPIFWGLFILFGGQCMITHGYCNCCVRMHNKSNVNETSN